MFFDILNMFVILKVSLNKNMLCIIDTITNINKKKYIKKGTKDFYLITLALFFAGFSVFSILYSVQPIFPLFSKCFHLTPFQSSLSLSSATITMACGMLFTGSLSDYYGRKLILCSSLLLASILTMICSICHSWKFIVFIRILTGFTLSGVTNVAMIYLTEEMHVHVLPISIALYISGNTIGGISGRMTTNILSQLFSWNIALFVVGLFSFFSSILSFYCLPTSKNFQFKTLDIKKLFRFLFFQCKDIVLLKLFIIGFIIMGVFVTVFNFIGYRLIASPFFLNQSIIGLISLIYFIGVYTSVQTGFLVKKYNKILLLYIFLILMMIGFLITIFNIICLIIIGLIFFAAGFFSLHSLISCWLGNQSTLLKGYASSWYLFFYYLGGSIFGSIGGYIWLLGGWSMISIFVIFLLMVCFFLVKTISSFKDNF
ncbi:MAG: MFS transporter [Buchnera aphidicola (Eriosoma harunire)]